MNRIEKFFTNPSFILGFVNTLEILCNRISKMKRGGNRRFLSIIFFIPLLFILNPKDTCKTVIWLTCILGFCLLMCFGLWAGTCFTILLFG
jgi:hypothetical protein